MTKNLRLRAIAGVAVALCVAAVVAAPAVVYADRYGDGSSPSETARQRLDHAEQEVHAVRDILARSDLQEHPSLVDNIRNKVTDLFSSKPTGDAASKVGETYDRVKQAVFNPEQYAKVMHQVKVAVGAEDPSLWEKIREAFGMTRHDSVADQLRYAFGIERVTGESLYARFRKALSGAPESAMDKVRRALGMDSGSTGKDWFHRFKVALGAEDPTVIERIRDALEPKWTDRVMHPLTSETRLTFESALQRVKDGLGAMDPRHQDTVVERIKKSIGLQEPNLIDRITDKYGTGLQDTIETGAHLTKEVADAAVDKATDYLYGTTYDNVVHQIKLAVGAEDPTVWESIKSALEHPSSLGEHVRKWIGAEGLTRQALMDRVTTTLNKLDPRKRDTTLEKVKKAIGWQEPSAIDKALDSAGEATKRAAEKASEILSGGSLENALHQVKVAVGYEDPTIWETIQSAIAPHDSFGDKVRHVMGGDRGVTRQQLFEKIKQSIPELSRRDSVLVTIKKALGLEDPSTFDKLRGRFAGATDNLLSSDALKDLAHRAKVAIGVEDPSTWESIKAAFDFEPSVFDRVKHMLGASSGITRNDVYERVAHSLEQMDPRRREGVLAKVKKAVGLQEPGLLERVKDQFTSAGREVGGKADEALNKATEILRGSSYDEAMHKLKVTFGQEDPTLWEQIRSALNPDDSLTDKVRHMFGRDAGVTRNTLLRRAEDALSGYAPSRRDSLMQKVKTALGLEAEPTLLGRAKAGFDHLLGRDESPRPPISIDQALEAFRSSSGSNREEAYNRLRKALENARIDMKEKASSLYEMVGGHARPYTLERAVKDLEHKAHSAYDSMLNTVNEWTTDLKELVHTRGRGSSWLMESFKEENGLSQHYVNDNGREFLDVTGLRAEERSFDKLRALNAFRSEFNLKPYDELPANASVQLHSVKRPHVLFKSSRYVDGNRYDYVYDDGAETLSVEWNDRTFEDKRIDAATQNRLLNEFRELHGLSIPIEHEPAHVRGHIRKYKSDL